MLDSVFMSPCTLRSSDRNVHGEDLLLPLGREKRCSYLRDENYCLHYVYMLIQLVVACNLIQETFAQ